jgi:hypothetical protein
MRLGLPKVLMEGDSYGSPIKVPSLDILERVSELSPFSGVV